MTRFTKEEVSQIITGVIQGQGPKGIAMRIGRKMPSVVNVIRAMQKDKPLFQRMLDGESVEAIAQKYVDDVTEGYSAKGLHAAKVKLAKNPTGPSQLSRIEAKLGELLALYSGAPDARKHGDNQANPYAYDAQGKRRSFFG